MKPGLLLVLDKCAGRAAACVAGMREALVAAGERDVRAARGSDWAAAVIATPGRFDG